MWLSHFWIHFYHSCCNLVISLCIHNHDDQLHQMIYWDNSIFPSGDHLPHQYGTTTTRKEGTLQYTPLLIIQKQWNEDHSWVDNISWLLLLEILFWIYMWWCLKIESCTILAYFIHRQIEDFGKGPLYKFHLIHIWNANCHKGSTNQFFYDFH